MVYKMQARLLLQGTLGVAYLLLQDKWPTQMRDLV